MSLTLFLPKVRHTRLTQVCSNLTRTADFLASALQRLGYIIMSQGSGKGLPLVAFRLDPANQHGFDEFAIARRT